ncbi:hypothetical protein BKA82DRAFT_414863 [Pisolithus tinctorius]|uniref:Uncharacterized protein n=1 Tax=Pisolithus tinctorius Marx 270 TaxID=870435 RepID=A0A0C3IA90_PISTI|nr:hypothetical protein BKA82DRAFT_414863 [Pisolithus tinctorius]KIN94002.1 hypothetical protein M404DRAFT_414863 [Pisolithus tinctorius Marx 270]
MRLVGREARSREVFIIPESEDLDALSLSRAHMPAVWRSLTRDNVQRTSTKNFFVRLIANDRYLPIEALMGLVVICRFLHSRAPPWMFTSLVGCFLYVVSASRMVDVANQAMTIRRCDNRPGFVLRFRFANGNGDCFGQGVADIFCNPPIK